MKKFFSWVWKGIKSFWKEATSHIFWAIGLIFTLVIPLYMLAQKVAITQEYTLGWKLSFLWLIVFGVLAIVFWVKIKNKINTIKPRNAGQLILQVILMAIHNSLTLAIWFFLLKYLTIFMSGLFQWFSVSLLPIGIGIICFIINKIVMYNKAKRQAKIARDKLKEQIKSEIRNGE